MGNDDLPFVSICAILSGFGHGMVTIWSQGQCVQDQAPWTWRNPVRIVLFEAEKISFRGALGMWMMISFH